jgi:hypothetical protein
VPTVVSANELLSLRDTANAEISNLFTWMNDHKHGVPEEILQTMSSALRHAMRREIEIELKNSPRPLFAEMSSGQESQS